MAKTKAKDKPKNINVKIAEDNLMMLEVAKGSSYTSVAKAYGVHHSYVSRKWQSLTQEQRDRFTNQADDVQEAIVERVIERETNLATQVIDIKNEANKLMGLVIDNLTKRLQSSIIKASDEIRLLEVLHTILSTSNDPAKTSINNIFNMFDTAISEQITINQNKENGNK